jgi:hypothetical protein
VGLFDDVLSAGQKGLGLVGSGLQKVGGAMGGQVGTPGINPVAPDPRSGLGMAKPQRPSITEGPADLSDLPFVTRLVMALDDGFKHNEGMQGEGDRLRAQRQQAAEQRRLAWTQNVEMVDKFRAHLDTVPLNERDSRAAKLRDSYVREFGGPGSEELFDTIIGAGGDAEAISSQLRDDPEIQAMLMNNPQASMLDVNKIRQSPQFLQRAVERQDQALLPSVEKKLGSLLSAQTPTMREAIARVQKDGAITVEEIKQLNEMAGEGPEGYRLTPGELSTLARQQGALAQLIPGFKTTDEFGAARQKEADLADFRSKENIKQQHKIELERERARLRPPPSGGPGGAPSPTSQLAFYGKVDAVRRVYFDTEAKLSNAVNSPLNGTGDIQALYSFVKNQDDTAAREGELALAQTAASTLDKLQRVASNVTDGRLLSDTQRKEIRQILEQMRDTTRTHHKEYVGRTKTVAESLNVPLNTVLPDYDVFAGGKKPSGRIKVTNGS